MHLYTPASGAPPYLQDGCGLKAPQMMREHARPLGPRRENAAPGRLGPACVRGIPHHIRRRQIQPEPGTTKSSLDLSVQESGSERTEEGSVTFTGLSPRAASTLRLQIVPTRNCRGCVQSFSELRLSRW